jgi:hypothetical protein
VQFAAPEAYLNAVCALVNMADLPKGSRYATVKREEEVGDGDANGMTSGTSRTIICGVTDLTVT